MTQTTRHVIKDLQSGQYAEWYRPDDTGRYGVRIRLGPLERASMFQSSTSEGALLDAKLVLKEARLVRVPVTVMFTASGSHLPEDEARL